jgi:hypothetical protein
VLQALSVAGWGIVWASSFHLVIMVVSVIGWRLLLAKPRLDLPRFWYVLWVRAAINNLMPVARIGGEIVAVRLLIQMKVRKSQAIACTVVETTLSVIAVFLISIMGVSLFTMRISDQKLEWQLLVALLLSVPMIAGLLLVQKNWRLRIGNEAFFFFVSRSLAEIYSRYEPFRPCYSYDVPTCRSGDRLFDCANPGLGVGRC